jgi:hypothetical protein
MQEKKGRHISATVHSLANEADYVTDYQVSVIPVRTSCYEL